MTEPQPVMAQPEQDQLTRQVGRSLLTVTGDGWQRVRAEYRSAGRHIEVDVYVTGPDGAERPVRPPQEVVEGLGRLRQGMYRPGRGTWFSAVYELQPPSAFSAEFEPDVEPRWRRVPPPIGFADELRFFPRADEHIPDWLRQRAGLPPVERPAEQDASGPPAPQGPPTPPPGTPTPPPTPPPGMPAQHGPGPQQAPPPGVPANPYPAPHGGQNPPGQPTPPPGFNAPTPPRGVTTPTPPPGFNAPPAPPRSPGYNAPPAPTPPPGMAAPPSGPQNQSWFGDPTDPPPLHVPATGPYRQD